MLIAVGVEFNKNTFSTEHGEREKEKLHSFESIVFSHARETGI